MPIVSSAYTVGHAQRDGSRRVVERHTWDDGSVTELEYGPVPVVDYQAIANARAVRLQEQAAQAEFEELIGGA
jgi:hypothetical protein